MTAKEFLQKQMTDKQFNLKLDWEIKKKPTNHEYIHMLMEEYAKHVIELNLCTGAPIEFRDNTIKNLKETNQAVNILVEWVNSKTK